jgi:DNA polymerase III alpha subunit
MSIIESLGLLKVDFLGLRTLTIMARACELIEKRHNIRLNLDNIPIDDEETYKFISKGHTAGVFQLEGTGMTRYVMQMQPKRYRQRHRNGSALSPWAIGVHPALYQAHAWRRRRSTTGTRH